MTRIMLTLLGVLVAVGLAGWAFAATIPRPDTTVETLIVKPAVQPMATPAPAPAPAPSAVATGSTESSSVSKAAAPAVKPTPKPKVAAPAPSPAPITSAKSGQFVVVVDAGHQGKGNNTPEPIGPGSKSTKPAVASGANGSVTKRDESIVNLEVSLKIQKELEARGVKVIMVRTSQKVNIPNSKRAELANKAGADLLLRIHCDDVSNRSLHGLLTMVPAKNKWTGPIVAPSAKAGKAIQSATLKTTGAHDRGIMLTSEMSGFNWSEVPAVIVEMGMMSNASDDRLLSSAVYQNKLATGISNGVVAYLNSTR
ncbi:MAG: N-acetylmuramoyl-L-alanine amidase [Actinomycetes bacterium]